MGEGMCANLKTHHFTYNTFFHLRTPSPELAHCLDGALRMFVTPKENSVEETLASPEDIIQCQQSTRRS